MSSAAPLTERSLFSRIAWIITLGFLVLWLVGHTFAAHERMLLATRAFASAMIDRTLLVGELIDAHPEQRDDLLDAFDVPGTDLVFGDQPPPDFPRQWNHATEIINHLTGVLDSRAPGGYRIAFPMARRSDPALPRGPYVLVAVELPSGRWLSTRATTNNMEWGWRHVMVSWSSLMMLLILSGVLWAARRSTRHLPRFALAAEQLGSDVNSAPLQDTGPREVRRAVQAFNRMQERIREQVEERTDMLAAVSHDLRTYLTRLALRAEKISDPGAREDTHRDLDEMNEMLEEVLAFSRAERNEPTRRPLDLVSLLQSLLDEQRDFGNEVTLEAPHGLVVDGDPTALKRALSNIVDNAIRYGARADVTVEQSAESVEICIDDRGPGVPPEQRDAVLRPFFRLEGSRNRDTGGNGLGLAIARAIVSKHGGELQLDDAPSGGLRVRIRLPRH